MFSYKDDGRHKGNIPQPPLDGKANEELWNRLSSEVVEDRALLEGASETPAKVLKLAQDWVHFDKKAKTKDSPRYRFFLVFDDEVIDHLLQLPKPADHKASIPAVYSVKVFDARFNSPAEFSGAEDSDSDAEDVTDDFFGFEGWFWTPASLLAQLWFCDYQSDEELITTDDFWEKLRLVYGKAMWRYTLPRSSKFWEDASLRQ